MYQLWVDLYTLTIIISKKTLPEHRYSYDSTWESLEDAAKAAQALKEVLECV